MCIRDSIFCDMSGLLYYKALLTANTNVSLAMNADIKVERSANSTDRQDEITAYPIEYEDVALYNPCLLYTSFAISLKAYTFASLFMQLLLLYKQQIHHPVSYTHLKDFFQAVLFQTDTEIDSLVDDFSVFTNLEYNTVHPNDERDRIQRAVLPFLSSLVDFVRNDGNG